MPLNVAEACSGMHGRGVCGAAGAVALISARHWWQRVAVLVLALPVAILMNVVRVAILGIATKVQRENWPRAMPHDDRHGSPGAGAHALPQVWAFPRSWTTARHARSLPRPWCKPAAGKPPDAGLCRIDRGYGVLCGCDDRGNPLRRDPPAQHAITAPGDRKLDDAPTENAPTWKRVGTDKPDRGGGRDSGHQELPDPDIHAEDRKPGDPPMEVQVHAAYYTGMVDTVPHVPSCALPGRGHGNRPDGTKVVDLKLDPSGWSGAPGVDGAAKKGLFRQRSQLVAGRRRA